MEIDEKYSRIYELVDQIRNSPVRTKTILLDKGQTAVLGSRQSP
jgi:hypothetical protein